MQTIVPLKSALKKSIQRLGIEKRLKEGLVLHSWQKIVGPELSRVSSAATIKNGVLWLEVRNSAWANELSFLRPSLIKKINSMIGRGTVKEIRYRICADTCEAGPEGQDDGSRAEREARSSPDDPYNTRLECMESDRAGDLAHGIADERLRDAFSRAVAAFDRYRGGTDGLSR